MSGKVFLISPEAPVHEFAGAGEVRKIKPGGIRLGTLDNTKGNADHLLARIGNGGSFLDGGAVHDAPTPQQHEAGGEEKRTQGSEE